MGAPRSHEDQDWPDGRLGWCVVVEPQRGMLRQQDAVVRTAAYNTYTYISAVYMQQFLAEKTAAARR